MDAAPPVAAAHITVGPGRLPDWQGSVCYPEFDQVTSQLCLILTVFPCAADLAVRVRLDALLQKLEEVQLR